MNIKDIIKKVLNENTNPILKLLNKRGIDPIKDIDNTIDFLVNTIGLEYNEIIDFYKPILGDNTNETIYYKIFDDIFNPDDIYVHPQVYFDEEENELCDDILFLTNDGGEVMTLYLPGYFTSKTQEGITLNDSSPLLNIESEYTDILNEKLGDTWKEPFKEWVHNQFGETVKTIE